MRNRLLTACLLCSFRSLLFGQVDVDRIKTEGLQNSKVMDIAFHLTDVSGPRLTNSPGFLRAANWAKDELTKMGLVNATLEPWGDFGKGWEQTKCYVAMTAPYYVPFIAIPRAWTGSTPGKKMISSDVVLIKAKDSAELFQNYAGKLKDKIVMMYSRDTLRPSFTADGDRLTDEALDKMANAKRDTSRRQQRNFSPEQMAARRQQQSLQRQLESLTSEVAELNEQLAAAESTVDEQREQIDGLDEQLNAALAQRVEELEQYRSEFFGELKKALGDRPDLRVVGDRFVFQSELLFDSGSARLDPDGQSQLRALARTLQDVASRIPPNLDWVLRVDGHTDRQPIRDSTFRSNWELSTARAISVIEFLVAQGIAPEHLAAAGFGEYRPIDPADDEIAYRRNRRIEFKLTEG